MKKLVILIIVASSFYFYFTGKPSTDSIVNNMEFGTSLSYEGHAFNSEWGKSESIVGYLRRIDRHYDENIPIITYDLVITTEDFSNPDIVSVRNKGSGNYSWSSKTKPKGTILFYHTIPNSISSQNNLDDLKEGDSINISALVSKNNVIQSDTGEYIKLMHSNHKFILVEDVL